MSCPNWTAIAAAREALPEADPPGYREALAHLDSCPACRLAAAAADPLLLLSALGTLGDTAAGGRRAAPPVDIEMQNAVLALVRASRVAPLSEGAAAPQDAAPARRGARGSRAAAALLIGSLLALSGVPRSPRAGDPVSTSAEVVAASVAALPTAIESAFVEDLGRPEARVYELSEADLAVVLIVDPSLDV